jgi:5'-nucleotidase/UDP-sugar diphosphatase
MRALLALLLLAAPASAVELVVFHTNDVHGWMMTRPSKDDPKKAVGGAAAYKALIDAEKRPKLVLDGGDWWQGTPEGSLTKGDSMAEVFNLLGVDAMAVGNHDFDAGWERLRALIPKFSGDPLSANTRDAATGARVGWVKPWVIKDVAGVKVGIFGLTTSSMPHLVFAKSIAGITFRREVDEARDAVAELKKAGAEVIIACTHVGYEEPGKPPEEGEKAIAARVPGIDLIVGGHTHTFLRKPWRDPKNGTLVTQTGQYWLDAGRAVLTVDDKTHRVSASSDELIELDPASGSDPKMQALVGDWYRRVGKVYDVVIATASATLEREGDKESPVASWVADCFREWGHTDVALQNGGGVRSDMEAGPVTLRSIFNIMPFENHMAVARLTGAQLRSVLARGLGGIRMIQGSGLELSFRRPAPFKSRVASLKVAGAPVDDAKVYSVTLMDFMVQSRDDNDGELASADIREDAARDVLVACARRQKLIVPPAGRLTKVED